jgi:hypothetical protein
MSGRCPDLESLTPLGSIHCASPKGNDISAEGNALGQQNKIDLKTLKGFHNGVCHAKKLTLRNINDEVWEMKA